MLENFMLHTGSARMHCSAVVLKVGHTALQGATPTFKRPQENYVKLGGHSKLEWDTTISLPEYLKFTIESNVPFSLASPTAQKANLYFIFFYTYHVIASGFSRVTYLLSELCNCTDVAGRGDLCLSVTTQQSVIQELASVHQANY